MAKTSILTMSASVGGDGETVNYTPPGMPLSNPACPQGGPIVTNLFQGDNTINVLSNAVELMIVPASGNTAVLKLKGASGDTGDHHRPDRARCAVYRRRAGDSHRQRFRPVVVHARVDLTP